MLHELPYNVLCVCYNNVMTAEPPSSVCEWLSTALCLHYINEVGYKYIICYVIRYINVVCYIYMLRIKEYTASVHNGTYI